MVSPAEVTRAGVEGADALQTLELRAGRPIRDWDRSEAIWQYAFYEQLGWEIGDEGAVLVAESPFSARAEREKLSQVLFERFNVAGLFVAESGPLSLYAVGKTSGSVIDFGWGGVAISPVADGQTVRAGTRLLEDWGGAALSEAFARALRVAHPESARLSRREVVGLYEQAVAYAPPRGAASGSSGCGDIELELPGGGNLRLSAAEREACTRAVFQGEPGVRPSLAESVAGAVLAPLDPSQRSQCCEGFLLSGGGSQAAGLASAFQAALAAHLPLSNAVNLLQKPDYMPEDTAKYAAWTGGAILAKSVFTQNQHVTKFDYEEFGPSIIHRKCGL